MFDVLSFALAVATVALVGAPGAFLGTLAFLSLKRADPVEPRHAHRFAVLVPAHDEEKSIGRLLETLARLDYPRSLVSVHVVADNCTDATASAARAYGVDVHERSDGSRPGKGAALNWLLKRILATHGGIEAFVFLDADSSVPRDFLAVLSGHVLRGAQIVQTLNLVDDRRGGAFTTLRAISFRLVCHVRPAAYEVLGVSAGLHGNGMCITTRALRVDMWDEAGIVEDVGYHLRLVEGGSRVRFASDTAIRSLMPPSIVAAGGQTVRWERGKIELALPALRLARRALWERRWRWLVSAADVLVPPLGVVVVAGIVTLAVSAFRSDAVAAAIALLGLGGSGAYVLRGVALADLPPRRVAEGFVYAPVFIGWKLSILAQVVAGKGRGRWTRAARPPL